MEGFGTTIAIMYISLLISTSIAAVSFRYTLKKLKTVGKIEDLQRADYIRVEGLNVRKKGI